MSSYKTFAQFYDDLTENVDYKVRSEYISNFFSDCNKKSVKLLDLACGTGTFSKLFSDMGYSVTGIDISEEMLTVAEEKCFGKVNFLKGDITDFSLPDKYEFCICALDSINHLNGIDDVKKCFKCVYNSL
ncbi:MAG: class I SAM-dependent methyltransferase, partial [Eubacterium sp.]|nr:class I SAM-dependent methyltransferase [Eubacterium sp.]